MKYGSLITAPPLRKQLEVAEASMGEVEIYFGGGAIPQLTDKGATQTKCSLDNTMPNSSPIRKD